MTQTRKRPGGGSPDAINKSTDQSEFTQNDSPPVGQILPEHFDEFLSVQRHRLEYLADRDRPETWQERADRISAKSCEATTEKLVRRRQQLAEVHRLKARLAARRNLKERAERLRDERPGYSACNYADRGAWLATVTEENGHAELEIAELRCKSVACEHCGPWWLADNLAKLADSVDDTHDDFHITIATSETRKAIIRRLADRHRNHGDDYAALAIPLPDDRVVIVSTMPTPTSTPADYSEVLQVAGNAFEVIRLTAQETGKNPIEGCLLYTSPSPRDRTRSRMPSSA